jgi:hypothetical protein
VGAHSEAFSGGAYSRWACWTQADPDPSWSLEEGVNATCASISIAPTAFAKHDYGAGHSMFDFEKALRLVAKQTVLCVGDVMLDDFVYGEVTRISPEAPTPVLAVKHNTIEIGGAGNVARNIAALGAT